MTFIVDIRLHFDEMDVRKKWEIIRTVFESFEYEDQKLTPAYPHNEKVLSDSHIQHAQEGVPIRYEAEYKRSIHDAGYEREIFSFWFFRNVLSIVPPLFKVNNSLSLAWELVEYTWRHSISASSPIRGYMNAIDDNEDVQYFPTPNFLKQTVKMLTPWIFLAENTRNTNALRHLKTISTYAADSLGNGREFKFIPDFDHSPPPDFFEQLAAYNLIYRQTPVPDYLQGCWTPQSQAAQ